MPRALTSSEASCIVPMQRRAGGAACFYDPCPAPDLREKRDLSAVCGAPDRHATQNRC